MLVQDVMQTKLFTVTPETTLPEAIHLTSQRGVRHLPVLEGERLVGILSDRDLKRAMASQALYCAAKAGMDHFTRCVALEEAGRPNGAKLCSLAPGVIDTDMQVQLRGADAGQFPDVGNFIGLKEKGLLTSTAEAAARVLAILARPDFGANPVADVRD